MVRDKSPGKTSGRGFLEDSGHSDEEGISVNIIVEDAFTLQATAYDVM
jgi:hypothetical protein